MKMRSVERLRIKSFEKSQEYPQGIVRSFEEFLTQYISAYCFGKLLGLCISFKIRYNG